MTEGTSAEKECRDFQYYEKCANVLEEGASQALMMLEDYARRTPAFKMGNGHVAVRILRLALAFDPSKQPCKEASEEYRAVLRLYPDLPLMLPMMSRWYAEAADNDQG